MHSPWSELEQILVWYEQIFAVLPEHQTASRPFRQLVFAARSDRLKTIKANLISLEEHRSLLDRTMSLVAEFTRSLPSQRSLSVSWSFEETLTSVRKLTRELTEVLLATADAAVREDSPLLHIPNIVVAARQCREELAAVHAEAAIRLIGDDSYRGVDTNIGPLKDTLHFAESTASAGLPEKAVRWLLCREYGGRLPGLRSWLSAANACGTKLQAVAEDLSTLSGSAVWSDITDDHRGRLSTLAQYSLASLEELNSWNDFVRLRIKSKEAGLDRLTALAETARLEPHEIGPGFRFAFYNTLARSVFTEHAELSQVTGITQEQIRLQFAAADKESIRLYSERVAALIDRRFVPPGNQSGPVRTWSQIALIMNEINKQKPHIPIRQLILRSADALVALKPCFMMGPLSVAQYLAPGKLKFDLVVMDEASQLKPEDAIGAIARGTQIVIVGDPKQLPPTSFFQRVLIDPEDDTDDDRAAVEEGESILDVASTLFQPVRRLRWHYRSRHHSLIAFSNNEFYQRNLIIFPSAYHDDPSLGVKHHFIHGGVFDPRGTLENRPMRDTSKAANESGRTVIFILRRDTLGQIFLLGFWARTL